MVVVFQFASTAEASSPSLMMGEVDSRRVLPCDDIYILFCGVEKKVTQISKYVGVKAFARYILVESTQAAYIHTRLPRLHMTRQGRGKRVK